jgi:hypothetical protein
MLRLELLKVKADLERELETWVPNCTKCGLDVHWVSGLGVTPGHWAHREPGRTASRLSSLRGSTSTELGDIIGRWWRTLIDAVGEAPASVM